MDDKALKAWEDYLDPTIMRRRLVVAALYILAFETTRDRVVERLRLFFADGFDKDGPITGDRYRDQVRVLHKNPYRASLQWLVNNGVIVQVEMDALLGARDLRNRLAHELAACVGQWPADIEEVFDGLVRLLHKIELWWIINVEMATDPDFDGQDVDESEVVPGAVMTLMTLRDVALAPEDEAGAYLTAFREAIRDAKGAKR